MSGAIPAAVSSSTPLNPASLPFVPGGSAVAPPPATISSVLPSANALSSNEFDDLKSPISLVHESALKRNLKVTFEVTRETGPPHMRTFLTRCIVGEFVTDGEGNGKKVSAKILSAAAYQLGNTRSAFFKHPGHELPVGTS